MTSIAPREERGFFDSAGCPLYGVLRRGSRPGGPLVLFCNAFAQDLAVNWRQEILAARELTARGYPTFSYHPRAHGDSAGNFDDLTLDGLVADALAAADHALAAIGASRVVWNGIRFGALVAAEAMSRRADTIGLSLWEPIHSAGQYLRSLMRGVLFREVARGNQPALTVDQMVEQVEREGSADALQTEIYRTFYRSAIAADLAHSLETWHGPTMLVQIRKRPTLAAEHQRLKESLERRGAEVRTAFVNEDPPWDIGDDGGWDPRELARQTGEWLDGLA